MVLEPVFCQDIVTTATVDANHIDAIHPHSDAAQVQRPAIYAEFIADMWDAGMVTLGSLRVANVSISRTGTNAWCLTRGG